MALYLGDCLNIWASVSCISLLRHHSDHNPLLLNCQDLFSKHYLFRFRSMWLTHKDFLGFVKEEWIKAYSYGSSTRVMMCKLRHLCTALRHWNYAVFW